MYNGTESDKTKQSVMCLLSGVIFAPVALKGARDAEVFISSHRWMRVQQDLRAPANSAGRPGGVGVGTTALGMWEGLF